jgi:hypothetical protein
MPNQISSIEYRTKLEEIMKAILDVIEQRDCEIKPVLQKKLHEIAEELIAIDENRVVGDDRSPVEIPVDLSEKVMRTEW